MILHDKVVVITGASEGIGRAVAERLVSEGARLALVARSEDRLNEVARTVGGEAFPCDIRDKAQVKVTVEAIVTKLRHIDVLINNAGIWQKVDQLDNLSDETVDDVLATNLSGTIYMTKYALPHLRSGGEKAIVQIVSQSGINANDGQTVYAASKWGVRGFTEVLRNDLKGTDIKIGAVYQGGTDTAMFRKAGEDPSPEKESKRTRPEDLADAIAYMLTRPPRMWIPELQVKY